MGYGVSNLKSVSIFLSFFIHIQRENKKALGCVAEV